MDANYVRSNDEPYLDHFFCCIVAELFSTTVIEQLPTKQIAVVLVAISNLKFELWLRFFLV